MNKILMIHAFYEQPGGEDVSYAQERDIFRRLGYEIIELTARNADLQKSTLTGLRAIFNVGIFIETFKIVRISKPRAIYVNNVWPGISPSPLLVARILGIPTLQAVRNYRLICPSAKLDDTGSCINCGGLSHPWSCIRSGCYRESFLQSATVAMSSALARAITRGWQSHRYLTTSAAVRSLFAASGMDVRRMRVRPNFIGSPPPQPESGAPQGALYVGRLSVEKGVLKLAENWPSGPGDTKLRIIGDGPQRANITDAAKRNPNVEYLGQRSSEEVFQALKGSAVSFVPSQWAEPFGRSAIESMAVGTPVVCTRAGALPDIVGEAGVVLEDLKAELIRAACDRVSEGGESMRRVAYGRFLSSYSARSAMSDMRLHLAEIGV